MESVHADGVAARLDVRRAAGGLEHSKLSLELDGVAAIRLEGVADGLLVEAALDRRAGLSTVGSDVIAGGCSRAAPGPSIVIPSS